MTADIIKDEAVTRRQLVQAKVKLDLQIQAILRAFCGGSKDEARKVFKAVEKDLLAAPITLGPAIRPLMAARAILVEEIEKREAKLVSHAKELPVAPWVKGVDGFGLKGLALIIGETGDLSNYSCPSKVWKRLGLAVINGERQRCPKGVTEEEAYAIGYSKRRRSTSWTVADSFLRRQLAHKDKKTGGIKKEAGPYGQMYYEAEKAPDAPPVAHDKRARRYVEKALIRDLWCAWQAAA